MAPGIATVARQGNSSPPWIRALCRQCFPVTAACTLAPLCSMNLVILDISIGRCPTRLCELFDLHTLIEKTSKWLFPSWRHSSISSFLGFPAHLVYVKSSYCRAKNYAFLRHIYEIARDKCCFSDMFLMLSEFCLVLLSLWVLIQVIFRTFFSFWSRISEAPFIFRTFVT